MAKRTRLIGKPFKPGISGNPSGRPAAVAKIRELAREQTERAFGVLTGIMEDEAAPAAARVSAANSILDRGWGKPAQPLTGEDGEGGPTIITFSWLPTQEG